MTHTHAKVQGQRSLGSKVRMETEEWMDGLSRLHYLSCYHGR